ncbi:hypothetical protein BDV29DRAFT_194567 [Aspergillus leporis]|uniref:F-box domain-containing protein n=1 Tax=Aspergillus leporis TaxID=41062 RepID=A0A5N5WRN7_9EURO|nr:hypothetical protein BDV29DRAFT_194567 [Aspergillus leporis]
MESICKSHVSLHFLPAELLAIIVQLGQVEGFLKPLSQVNKAFRQLCAPILFSTLRITSSITGLNCLTQASRSPISPYVRTIYYEASELLDPRKGIIRSAQDAKVLCASFPCFPHLDTILLRFADNIKQPFQWLADRVLLDGRLSFPDHIEKVATAIVAAKEHGISIHTFAIFGFYPRSLSESPLRSGLLNDALADIQELRVEESPAVLEFFTQNPLPHLRRFELGSYWISATELEEFIYAHANTLRFLHLEDIWLLNEKHEESSIYLSLASTEAILESISHIRRSGILRELTMNRDINGHCEIRELLGKE